MAVPQHPSKSSRWRATVALAAALLVGCGAQPLQETGAAPGARAESAGAPAARAPSGAATPQEAQGARPFASALVRRGGVLAAIGDCRGCHTADGGRSYAGGRALPTPFGTVYGTNITPDDATGIGTWSRADFARAMREGVDAEGHDLYPVFPYDHFRHLTDEDLDALYAYLMTRDPVRATPPRNALRFPFNLRPLLRVWKALWLDDVALPADPQRGRDWNRGAYLVAGVGHCGACHTPRNAMGAEIRDRPLAGGEADGWHAPALDAATPTPVPWSVAALHQYLATGLAPRHSIAGGPMAPVTRALADVPDEDVRAIAVYVASLQPPAHAAVDGGDAESGRTVAATDGSVAATDGTVAATEGTGAAVTDDARHAAGGAAVYRAACASCHDAGRRAWPHGALPPRDWLATALPTSANLVRIVVAGIHPPPGERGRWMPAFATSLTPAQIEALAAYLRAEARRPAWQDVRGQVQAALEAAP